MRIVSLYTWNPPKEVFPWNIPLLGRPILWYGVLFALGFFLGYLVLCHLLKNVFPSKKKAHQIAEQFLLFVGVGALVGARLADVFFYQDPRVWLSHPLEILFIWEGGLSSHGGALGALIGLLLLQRHLRIKLKEPAFGFLTVLDYTVIPAALAGACIRIGNFINQEILGKPTDLPWGILFLNPADRGPIVPRHPVQLYESAAYLVIFLFLLWCFKKKKLYRKPGLIGGWFFVLVFGFRFLIEFLKEEQSALMASWFPLTMGQLLSVPLVLAGIYLLLRASSQGMRGRDS